MADFVHANPQGQRYQEMADRIGETLAFIVACGFTAEQAPQLPEVSFYTSHEALLLNYEEALTRPLEKLITAAVQDSQHCFGGSAHLLWLGDRTRQLDGTHVEYLRGIANPVGIKIRRTTTASDALQLLEQINPQRRTGRMQLIIRMGAGQLPTHLPLLLAAVRNAAHPVVWACDPMHSNTVTSRYSVKTCDFSRIVQEVREFFAVHASKSTVAGGLHVELNDQDVTEYCGGGQNLTDDSLKDRYTSACDPCLNGLQSLELAFWVAALLKSSRSV